MGWAALILGLVTAQRLGELLLARSNTRGLLAEGGYEVGASHYPLIVALHVAWLSGLWYLTVARAPAEHHVDLLWLALFVALQLGRVWVIASLGRRWTTRIIVVRDAPLVRRGPYRFMSHPNYWVVAGEILVLPLVFGLAWYGLVFTVLNAAMMWIRIRAETAALKPQ
jgi:methyltransferase